MDWGAYVIVASLVWPDGHVDTYHPTTRFDEQSCFKEAKQLNTEWLKAGTVGFATCRKAEIDLADTSK